MELKGKELENEQGLKKLSARDTNTSGDVLKQCGSSLSCGTMEYPAPVGFVVLDYVLADFPEES